MSQGRLQGLWAAVLITGCFFPPPLETTDGTGHSDAGSGTQVGTTDTTSNGATSSSFGTTRETPSGSTLESQFPLTGETDVASSSLSGAGTTVEIDTVERNESPTGSDPPMTDLAIERIRVFPEEPVAGQNTTISVVVVNIGSVEAPPSEATLFMGGSPVPTTASIPALLPNQSHSFEFTTTLSARIYIADATADSGETIPEVDESNNERTLMFEVFE